METRKSSRIRLNEVQIREFRERLLAWFRQFRRELPWRGTNDPYRIWMSEIMLQQTRVAAVIPYYERFLERFPDVHALAGAPQEEVLRLWSGLGYYSRARNLQEAARQIVARHDGQFPFTREEALALPGIGEYTAAAILSIAYGESLAVLDGNVARVVARVEAVRGDLRETPRWRNLQQSAAALLDPESPGDWNQAMMELGATLCTPRSPQCLLCPISDFCEARKHALTDLIPEKRRKPATVRVTLASAVFVDAKSRTLLLPPPAAAYESPADDTLPLTSHLWHFPTIVVKQNARRELALHLKRLFPGQALSPDAEPSAKVRHAVTYREITLLPFRITVKALPKLKGSKSIPLADLSSVPASNLTKKTARTVLLTIAARPNT